MATSALSKPTWTGQRASYGVLAAADSGAADGPGAVPRPAIYARLRYPFAANNGGIGTRNAEISPRRPTGDTDWRRAEASPPNSR